MMTKQLRLSVLMFILVPFMVSHAQWSSDPALNNVIVQAGNNQVSPRLISDGKGGAIICWSDERVSQNSFDVYAQRIDKNGFTKWTVNGIAVSAAVNSQSKPDIVSDGKGGAIIVWTDTRDGNNDIYAQRIDSTGKTLWAVDGVPLTFDTTNQADPKVTTDGSGGAIVTWNGATGGFPPTSKIYAQRLDAAGNRLWSSDALVSGTLRFSNAPCIASDGSGGAYIAYAYYPRPEYDVYAQRIDGTGAVLWDAKGVGIDKGSGSQDSPVIVADGAGNAFVGYLDWASGATPNVKIAVLKRNGTMPATMGVTSTTGGQANPQLTLVGIGSVGMCWDDGRAAGKRRVYAQIFDTTGAKTWATDGVGASNRAGDQITPYIVSDDNGGVILSWEDKTKGAVQSDIYAQRISAAGATLWSTAGAPVCTADKIQQFPWMISDGQSGAIMVWEDYRPSYTNVEVFASRILADGSFPIGPPMLSYSSKSVAFSGIPIGSSLTKNVTITNTGGAPVSIAAITTSDPQFTMTTDNSTINPSGNVTGMVKFKPTTKNTTNAFVIIESNSIFSPDTIAVSGRGIAEAGIEIDKTSMDFGNVNTGSTKSLVLKISNPGNDTLTVSSITSNNPKFTVAAASLVIEPGGSFADTVRFSPTVLGSVVGTLTLTSNAPTSPTTVALSGTGAKVMSITIDRTNISFGEVAVGSSKDTTLTITNSGNDILSISAFTSGDSHFTLETPITTIAPAGVKTFTLRYSPEAAGPISTIFTVTSNAISSPDTITVDGTGVVNPVVFFSPPQLSFGEVGVGSTKNVVLTITNTGGQTLTVTDITSTNPDFSALLRQFEVPGGGSYTDTIRFEPSVLGDRNGNLTIMSNAATSPDIVPVEGRGTDPSSVQQLQAHPGAFTLFQNYPNPFRPSTTIRYDLEISAPVRVTVYNSIGKVMATLVDEMQNPGMHSVLWTPSGNAPGMYFYVLRVGTYESFGTMVLMK